MRTLGFYLGVVLVGGAKYSLFEALDPSCEISVSWRLIGLRSYLKLGLTKS